MEQKKPGENPKLAEAQFPRWNEREQSASSAHRRRQDDNHPSGVFLKHGMIHKTWAVHEGTTVPIG